MRTSGIIYNSIFGQIKKMHAVDPEKAGELAISAIELILTGDISSDDVMVDMLLTPLKEINDRNVDKYEKRVESAKEKKIREMRLVEIANLHKQGLKQKEIGEKLNMSQQTVSYRVNLIKTSYPDLLGDGRTNILQTNVDVYQNTNENTKFCENVCIQTKNEEVVEDYSQRDEFSF